MPSTRARRAAAGAVCCLALAGAGPAVAATKNGIRPVSPKPGAKVAAGKAPVFKGRVRGRGSVWVYACKSPKRNAEGLICRDLMIEKARKRKGRFSVRPRFFDYASFWLNRPGTYYWQAHRIDCSGGTRDCSMEGPVVKFRVK